MNIVLFLEMRRVNVRSLFWGSAEMSGKCQASIEKKLWIFKFLIEQRSVNVFS